MHVIPSVKKEIKYCKFAGFFICLYHQLLTCQPVRDLLKRKLVKITENTQTRNLKKKIFVSSISVKNFVFKNCLKHGLVPLGN